MKLNLAERLLVNNHARALVQRFYEAPLLRRLGGTVQDGTVLEIGCGRGAGIEVIFHHFGAAHVCGLDLDLMQLERAQKRLESKYTGRLSLIQGDAEQLPFADATFDAVFDFGALHHIPNWQRSVAEVRRVLKPRGKFFFEEVTRAALGRWIYRQFFVHPNENRFSESEFLVELESHGFRSAGPLSRRLFGDIFIGAARLY
jgi:ubiquinone/menaquinone biosynthesis C-methylase UbiE